MFPFTLIMTTAWNIEDKFFIRYLVMFSLVRQEW